MTKKLVEHHQDTLQNHETTLATDEVSAPSALTTTARHYLQHQSRIGMRAAMQSIQRRLDDRAPWEEPDYVAEDEAMLAPPMPTTIDNWPDTLPIASRVKSQNPKEDTNIKVALGKSRNLKKDEEAKDSEIANTTQLKGGGTRTTAISKPAMTNDEKGFDGTLTDDQKAVITQIRNNREAVNADKLKLQQYDGAYGYVYGGKPSEDATPAALTGTADTTSASGKRKQAEQWIWEEMAHEGSSASINAYDSQMVTWGRGLGAKTGGLNPSMTILMKNPSIANRFLSLGIGFKGGWLAVNLTTGAIEIDKNALAIIQTDPHILAALVEVGEGNAKGNTPSTDEEKTAVKQDVANAQWAGIQGAGSGKIPQYVLDDGWSKAAVQIGAHITHWGGKYGWHMNSSGYRGTGGDITKMVDMVVKLLAENANPNGAYSVRSSGPALITNLRAWGGGAGLAAIISTYKSETLTDDQINKDLTFNNSLIIKRGEADKEGKLPVYTKKQ